MITPTLRGAALSVLLLTAPGLALAAPDKPEDPGVTIRLDSDGLHVDPIDQETAETSRPHWVSVIPQAALRWGNRETMTMRSM